MLSSTLIKTQAKLKKAIMTQEEDEVFEILNSHVSYWGGLKSLEFWSAFSINGLFSTLPVIITTLVIVVYFIFNVEFDFHQKLLLSTLLPFWSAFGIYSFYNQLKLYRLKKQLRLIKLAQQEQEK